MLACIDEAVSDEQAILVHTVTTFSAKPVDGSNVGILQITMYMAWVKGCTCSGLKVNLNA